MQQRHPRRRRPTQHPVVRRAAAACLLIASVGSGCSPDRAPGDVEYTTRDSSGVQLVDLHSDPYRAREWAAIDTVAALRIRPDETRPETLFGNVQDALRLGDGRIAVLDRRRYQLLVFRPDGSALRTIGRRGRGPGEFRFPTRLLRARGDSIAVADGADVEVFPLGPGDPRPVRLTAAEAGHSIQAIGALANGDFLTLSHQSVTEPRVGRHLLYATLGAVAPDGTPRRTLGRHVSGVSSYRAGGADGPMETMTLFWADPAGATLPDGYVWCLSTEFECHVWSGTSGHIRTIRSTMVPRAVTDADLDALTASWLHGLRTRADSARTREFIRAADRMERIPVLSTLRTDARGRVWMRAYVPEGTEGPVRWLVFDATGRVRGTLGTPQGLEVFDIGDDYILGAERDADDVQHVVMYRYSVAR